jgi:3-oxoacyl-[acyl-carrier protein] reductase
MRKVAVITGAGRGIGAATARELGRRGFHVMVNYRSDADSARKVAEDVEKSGGTASLAQADVCDPEQAADLVARCDTIDALVCNANIQPPFAPFDDLPWPDFIGKVTGELAAVFHVSKRALEVMRGRGAGRIVYVSSVAADNTRPGAIAHASAKAALEAFARHIAAEAGADGIGVNVIAPGAVRTDAIDGVLPAERAALLAERSVLHRMLEPEDVATAIAAVVDGDLRAVTGVRIVVDGGFRVLAVP